MPFHRAIPESKPPAKAAGGFASLVEAEKLMQIAFVLPSAVVIGWLLGWWADNHFHQSWIALAGIVLGSIAGMVSAIRMAVGSMANPKKEKMSGDETEMQGPGDRP
jgi:ATP synthase protein I